MGVAQWANTLSADTDMQFTPPSKRMSIPYHFYMGVPLPGSAESLPCTFTCFFSNLMATRYFNG